MLRDCLKNKEKNWTVRRKKKRDVVLVHCWKCASPPASVFVPTGGKRARAGLGGGGVGGWAGWS